MSYMVESPVMMWNQDEESPQFSINIVQSPPSMDSSSYNGSPGSMYTDSVTSPGSQYHQSNNFTSPPYSGSSTPNNLNLQMNNASPSAFYGDQQYVQNTQNYIYTQPMPQQINTMTDFHQSIPPTIPPHIEIVEQPEGENRFRYKSEMNGSKHGSLYGVNSSKKGKRKSYPTVKVLNGSGQITVRCSLSQIPGKDVNGLIKYSPHSHKLSRKSDERNNENGSDYCDVLVNAQNNYQTSFEGIGIIHTIRENIAEVLNAKKKIDMQLKLQRLLNSDELKQIRAESEGEVKTVELNKVVLRFQALIMDEVTGNYREICHPVYSNIIKNEKGALTGKLRIVRIKEDFSEAKGGSEHFLLVKKVSKTDIHVRFYELDENSEMAWNEVVKVPETDVHHQFALILKAPPYWNQNIKEPVSVFIELFRSADGCKSAQFPFTYTPNKNTEPSRKRARRESTLIPDVVTNINQMPIVPTYQQATENSANLDFFGNNAGFSGGSSMQCGYSSEQESYFSDSQENFYTEFNMDLLKNFTHPPLDLEALQKEFNIDLELGLETDAAVELAQAPKENVGLSEFVKIKTLVQAFQDEWNEKQLQVLLVKILEKNDENILFALIEEDNFNEFQELAIMLHKYKLIKYLHEKNDVHQNCLHFAVLLKKHHMLQSILAMGLDINAMDQNGDTPLHLAVYGNYLEGVEKLVANKKLKIDLMNHNGSTALEFATRNGNLAIVKILGESGASFTKKNPKNGNNLMHEAVSVDYCSPELIKHLLEINEEFFSEDKNLSGYQAYDLAKVMSCNYEILKLFKNEDELSEQFDNLNLSSNQPIEHQNNGKIFDDQCITDLSKILDRDDQWQILTLLFEFEGMVSTWKLLPSPSVAFLYYLELQSKTLDQLVEQLNVIDAREAISAIDEMIVRKMNMR